MKHGPPLFMGGSHTDLYGFAAMKKWEYKRYELDHHTEPNELREEGWEMVSVYAFSEHDVTIWFKRPLK